MSQYLCSMHIKAHCHPQKARLPTIYVPTREIVSSAYLRAQLQIKSPLSATNIFDLLEAQKVVRTCEEEAKTEYLRHTSPMYPLLSFELMYEQKFFIPKLIYTLNSSVFFLHAYSPSFPHIRIVKNGTKHANKNSIPATC